MASTTQIYEDAHERRGRQSPVKESNSRYHKRTGSVGAILRGRRLRENDPSKTEPVQDPRRAPERPLGERHINSPPNTQRVPLRGEDERPKMHKKTKSSVSLKSLISGRGVDSESNSSIERSGRDTSPKKAKSSTSLGALLKKKSTKNLKEEPLGKENSHPTTPTLEPLRSPIWEQFATQPTEDPFSSTQSPERRGRTIAEEIALYTPRRTDDNRLSQTMNQSDYPGPGLEEAPPRPPFLQHKSSRSSIFTEEGVDADYPVSPHYKIENDRPKSAYFEDARPSLGSRPSSTDQPQEINPKRSSRVVEAFQALTSKTKENRDSSSQPSPVQPNTPLSPQEIDAAFENVLDSRNIPHNMRDKMRSMDLKIKADFVKSHRVESGSSVGSRAPENLRPRSRSPIKSQSPKKGDVDQLESKRSRSKARGRGFTLSKGDNSPTKKQKSGDENRARSRSRPKSIEIVRPGSSRSMTSTSSSTSFSSKGRPESGSAPADFIHYLREVQKPELVEVGKMHKLRILLRNESVAWTDTFITSGGMDEVVSLLHRIIKVEWREEHEDTLLHETLLCLKGLCTTDLALQRLTTISDTLFPSLLAMLFDPERKGPAEFSTRSIIISLLFMHLTSAITLPEPQLTQRSRKILSFLADPTPEEGKQPLDFISQMHINRPYRVWCKEIVNVTKEVFWIFLHHLNVIPVDNGINSHSPTSSNPYLATYYPQPPPPHPAAPYVGGVEWEATLYLAAHLDLLNGLIVTLPTTEARNQLRQELKDSGVEKVMGATMRTAKEKFYGHMHMGLRFWVNAAIADGWKVEDVREGPPREAVVRNKSPMKKNKKEDAPPKLDLKIGLVGNDVNGNGNGKDAGTDGKGQGGDDGGWL